MNDTQGKPRRRFPASLSSAVPGSVPKAAAALAPQFLGREPRVALAASAMRGHSLSPMATQGLPPRSDAFALRQRMVSWLHEQGIRSEPVLEALRAVPRHFFVDSALADQAYENTSLPIGHGQTISKPSVVARMLEWLFLGDFARRHGHLGTVLEIGTGCGYQTAVLALLAQSVVSMERLRPLFEQASRQLRALDIPRAAPCRLIYGDGMKGAPGHAPFNSIIAAAVGSDLPQAWLEQLAIGGRLVAPACLPGATQQTLLIVDRTAQGWQTTVGEVVQFVPLKSGTA